jgi:hypothetical protein
VHSNTLTQVAAALLASFLALACSGHPEVVEKNGPDVIDQGGRGGKGSGGSTNVNGTGGNVIHFDDGGDANGGGNSSGDCKTRCEPGDCGPVADGCGNLIECGGCTAPETCGGGGEPSRCGGAAACTPQSCDDLGFDCGQQSDGCGGVLDCWSDDTRACADPAQQCIDGACTDTTSCDPLTCKDYTDPDLCGPVSDGCGGTLDCGFKCAADQGCGVIEAGKCGTVKCTPHTCVEAKAELPTGYCGFVPDGCGGEVDGGACAEKCTGSDTCGGGGTPDVCGHGTACEPKTSADCGSVQCGEISDGCGGKISCGTCSAPQTCGGGGDNGICGAPECVPLTCAKLGFDCGQYPDGCNGTLTCGSSGGACSNGDICNANKCQPVVCQPKSKAEACANLCGKQSDGCSSTYDCGGCTAPNTCGGGGTPSVCGSPPCTPVTCANVGANCGLIPNGCGGTVNCGGCTGADICGGSGTPSVCGHASGDPTCTGLCSNVVVCPANQETRLSGTVYAPNGTQPLYNALVYVPNAPLPTISTGPDCVRCQDEQLGNPLAAAITGADGKFVLRNVPAGVSFPLVVKMGKWRRVVTIPTVTQCTNVNLSVDQTRLPRNMSDAAAGNKAYVNIPKMAMVTGKVDEIECVLRKIGIDDSEFTMPSGTGRIHLYRANGAYATCTNKRTDGTCRSSGRVAAPLGDLFAGDTLDNYDLGIFDCEGSANEHDTYDPILKSWADRGGRVFASHYSYTYLHDNDVYANTATWNGSQNANGDTTTGIIDQTSGKGKAFNTWLGNVGAWSTDYGSGYIKITDPREFVQSVKTGSERFVYTDSTVRLNSTQINQRTAVQQYSFNTPVGANADNVCGRILYSAFHVAGASANDVEYFPHHCSTGPLTPQEEVLEFMLFDLSACVSVGDPPSPPTCKKKTCLSAGAACGQIADGCGGILECGTCQSPNSCGGGGTPNQCGNNCKRTTCGAQGANCGTIADGCGGTLNCGTCNSPAVCGGGGTANVCGVPQCTPRACTDVGALCGAISDGCGGTVQCGTCTAPQTCGGGGTPNVCGAGSCNPKTCQSEGAQCGFVGDGCGGTVQCGTCPMGQICGAAGPNKCGGGCTVRSCGDVGADCGFVGDGCGGVQNCGTCTPPLVCGGAGMASKCGGSCTARTCSSVGANCGAISDGCGSVLECGVCPAGQTCGAGGTNKCGAGSCTPKSCGQLSATCGSVGDGCGNVLNCGTCVAPQSCGGAGVPNQCGTGTSSCLPRTCAQMNANCGPVADGCGGLLDCGTCTGGESCGGGGTPSKCGSIR